MPEPLQDARDRALLAEAIMWDYEAAWLPPGMEVVDRPDLLMWRRTQGPFAQERWANRISYVRATPDRAEGIIDEALSFFGDGPFTWVVGPSTRPADLGNRLRRRGLVDEGDADLLTADLPLRGLRKAPDVKIVEVDSAELARTGLRLAHPGATDAELEAMTDDRLANIGRPGRRGGYLVAFLEGEPVANASYRYSADGRAVYLSGEETVERFRAEGSIRASSRIARTPPRSAAAATRRFGRVATPRYRSS